jgi:glycosyltransferase involved in cell wall biosynthesis
MRVAQVNLQRDAGGAERHVFLLSQGLQRSGVQVVVCCHPDGWLKTTCEAAGLETRSVQTANQLDLTAAWKLASRLRAFRPDVLHLHTPKDYLSGTVAARLLGRSKVVLTRHMLLPLKPMMKRVYSKSNATICLAEGIRERLAADGIDARLLHRVQPGIALEEFDNARTQSLRNAIREAWGVSQDDVVIGCVSRLVEGKGHADLLNAFRKLLSSAEDQPNSLPSFRVRLIVIGDGPLRPSLESQAEALKLREFVHFTGFCNDVPAELAGLDALVLPSHSELLPLSLLEGMASSLPIIASRVGGIPEIVEHGVTGLLIEPRDIDSLANALSRAVNEAALRTRLGQAGCEQVHRSHSIEAMVNATLVVYRSCA